MRWVDAISILTLVLSTGTLVITAVGTGSKTQADDTPQAPSLPMVIDADGCEVGALGDLVGDGEVGVIVFEPELELLNH